MRKAIKPTQSANETRSRSGSDPCTSDGTPMTRSTALPPHSSPLPLGHALDGAEHRAGRYEPIATIVCAALSTALKQQLGRDALTADDARALRDAIARLFRSHPRGAGRGGARAYAQHSPRERTARERSRESSARAGNYVARCETPLSEAKCRGGNVVSRKRQFTQNSTVREPERAFRGRTISRRDFACGASVRGGTAGTEIFFSPLT